MSEFTNAVDTIESEIYDVQSAVGDIESAMAAIESAVSELQDLAGDIEDSEELADKLDNAERDIRELEAKLEKATAPRRLMLDGLARTLAALPAEERDILAKLVREYS